MEFFDYDPVTGVAEYFHHDAATGKVSIHYRQDVQPVLDYAKHLRNTNATDKGIKEEWWQWAIIPPVVQMALRKKGIKLENWKKGAWKDAAKIIKRDYPYLLTTNKQHG